jgi:uncharacterized protein YkwD
MKERNAAMKALRTIALAAILLVVSAPAALGAQDGEPSNRMIEAINSIRADNGLKPLHEAPKLAHSSNGYAKHLMRIDSFGHGSSFHESGFRTAGEILAYSSGWSAKARPAIRMWLGSPSHRALMLSSAFRYVGAGLARGRFGGSMATIWVVHFGAH